MVALPSACGRQPLVLAPADRPPGGTFANDSSAATVAPVDAPAADALAKDAAMSSEVGRCAGDACPPPSCADLPSSCGPGGNESCCASLTVVGGSFLRSYDAVSYLDRTRPASVSTFRLDRFEVTVGRFRRFVAAWNAGWRPGAGAGKHVHVNGGRGLADSSRTTPYEQGWDATWTTRVAPTDISFQCNAAFQTWTSKPGPNENRPMNCVTWFDAYAFCIWDEGFLPSEAEWNYAAAGGNEQRVYPWSVPPNQTVIDCSRANHDPSPFCVTRGTNDVGAESPRGDGKYGQADLTGNVWEWTLDWFGDYGPTCVDCAYRPVTAAAGMIRGGGFDSVPRDSLVSRRDSDVPPSGRSNGNMGLRCARPPRP
jgi:formylglycine-generating enzyme required for sulfatase activity